MATKSEIDSAPENNGKPAKNAPAPVIRRVAVAEEDPRERLMKREVPACVISGLIHCVVIGVWILVSVFFFGNEPVKAKEITPTNTKMDEPPAPEPDLTNEDIGIDSELKAAADVDREADVVVEAPKVDQEQPGLPNQDKEFATQTSQAGPMNNLPGDVGTNGIMADGPAAMGDGGAGGLTTISGLSGRSGATKDRLLRQGGGNPETEAAVARALAWLAKQQKAEGYWEFDGSHKDDRVAATGMCILPFLAAGETHQKGRYKSVVAKGLDFLKSRLKASGQFGEAGMYAQAIATIAVCEAAGMTQDDRLKKEAKKAADFIVRAQSTNGSWGYTAGSDGDTSIVGWQVQALKSAKLAGIAVPDKVMEKAQSFLVSVSTDSESRYGYRTKGPTHTLSAVGLLSRIYLMNNARHPAVAHGVEHMWAENKPTEGAWDMYYYYYATQVVHFFDGKAWHQDWNPAMRKILLDKQATQNTANVKPADIGSWPMDTGFIGSSCGRLGTTCLACLTLEVYYRHLPLNKRDNVGIDVLEGKQK